MQIESTQMIYLSFSGYFDLEEIKDCPLRQLREEEENHAIRELLPDGHIFWIENVDFSQLIVYIKEYLNQEHMDFCFIYYPNQDMTISKRRIYNLFEEEPNEIQPGQYTTLGYILSVQRIFFNQTYSGDGRDIHVIALEKRENCEQLLLAYPIWPLLPIREEQQSIREIQKRKLFANDLSNHNQLPCGFSRDGREIDFSESSMFYMTPEYKDGTASALYEYLRQEGVFPESLTEPSFGFCLCKANDLKNELPLFLQKTPDCNDPLNMILHFPPQQKTCFVEQAFHASLNGQEQEVNFLVDDLNVSIYLAGLQLIDLFEGRSAEQMEHLKNHISQEERLLALAYEISDEKIHPMFYQKSILDNPPIRAGSKTGSTGWIVGPEKGTVGSHGLQIRYAFIEKVNNHFYETLEIELFSVQVKLPMKEDVSILQTIAF